MSNIKFLNIYRQDKKLHNNILKNIESNIKLSSFINAHEVKNFEKNFKKFFNAKYCVSCANGSDALFMALKALNFKKNSEIIVPAMTYIATANSVILAGHNIKFADTDLSGNILYESIKKKISKKTSGIIVVNLYGQRSIDNKIIKLCKKHKIKIIEDCAQSNGCFDCENCKLNNKNLHFKCCQKKIHYSKYSEMSCYSFFPGKNLGCYGDGGAILTENKKYEKFLLNFRNNGSFNKKNYILNGINSRLDNIQAGILNIKLQKLKQNNQKRRKVAEFFLKQINNIKIKPLIQKKGSVFHQFLVFCKKRNKLIRYLKKNKISHGIYYSKIIQKNKIFYSHYNKLDSQNAEYIAKYSLSIPIDPYLKNSEIKKIIYTLNNFS